MPLEAETHAVHSRMAMPQLAESACCCTSALPNEAESLTAFLESAYCFNGICMKPDVLLIDDFANTKMSEEDALQIFKVMEYRYGNKSTIIASQLEQAEWHKNFGSSQLADSILDRIVSNASKIILSGDSLRSKKIED